MTEQVSTYKAGDEIVHPHHGPGTVTDAEMVDVGDGPVPYVVVSLPDGMTVKVPADSLDVVGLREPVTEVRADEILAVLEQPAAEDPGHRVRRRRDRDKLASGRLVDCAEVVRDLSAVTAAHPSGGTYADLKMLMQARQQLAAELAVALGITEDAALERIEDALPSRDTQAAGPA
jgi:CarD family transcriptional regulator